LCSIVDGLEIKKHTYAQRALSLVELRDRCEFLKKFLWKVAEV